MLAQTADCFRGHLVVAVLVFYKTFFLQLLGQLGELLQISGGIFAQEFFGSLYVHIGQGAGVVGVGQEVFQLIYVAQFLHELHGIGEVQRVHAAEVVACAPAGVWEKLLQVLR